MAKVVVLSGAGISAESGINTFRDSGGLWEEYDVDEVCKVGCLENNREQTIEFYDKRRAELESKEPNHAHKVLSQLKNRYKDDIAIITQNVDNLFEKAGIAIEDVIHLHGYLTKVECEKCGCIYDIGYKSIGFDKFDGKCPTCGTSKIRPYIVMFGETAPNYELLNNELQNCELLVVIGTSGNVVGVNTMASFVKSSILNNLEPSDAIEEELFSKVLHKKVSDAIDEIADEIKILFENKVDSLTDNLKAAIVHMRNYDLDGLTFEYEKDAKNLYDYLMKIINEVDLTKEEFDSVITNLIVEFKHKRDNKLGEYEKAEEYNALICFFVTNFKYKQ